MANDAKLCFNAVLKSIFSMMETKIFHLKISKNQLAAVKPTNSKNKYPETIPLEKIVAVKSPMSMEGLFFSLKKIYPHVPASTKTFAVASRYCLVLWDAAIMV